MTYLSTALYPLLREPLTPGQVAALDAAADRIGERLVDHQRSHPPRRAVEPECRICATAQESLATLMTLALVNDRVWPGTKVRYGGDLTEHHGVYECAGACHCCDREVDGERLELVNAAGVVTLTCVPRGDVEVI